MKKKSTIVLLIVGFGLLGLGWAFQHFAFQSPSSPGQASVTVFVKDKSARLFLQADVRPASPDTDWLTIDVTGTRGKKEQWLLVVQCPSGSSIPSNEQPIGFYTEPGGNSSSPYNMVLASKHTGHWSGELGCFSTPATTNANTQATLNRPTTFIDATLLSLESDPAAQQNQIITPLYAEQDTRNGDIKDLVEVLQAPNAVCPSATSLQTQSPQTQSPQTQTHPTGPTPGTSASPSSSPSAIGMTSTSPSGAPTNPAATGSPDSSPSPVSAVCYTAKLPHTTASEYQLPTSVGTAETLENANLSGYRVDSIFPPEQITPDNRMVWKGTSNLTPSVSATNLSVERSNNRSLFVSGILFGVAGGLLVPVVQEILTLLDGARSKNTKNASSEASEQSEQPRTE